MQRKDPVNYYISLILKSGIYSSAAVLILGFVLLLFSPSITESKPFSLSELMSQLVKLNPYAFINLGGLILIFTPILRVTVAIISFSFEKDIRYIWISTGVFLILIFSIILFNL